jgi:DNA-binding transcriptional LysR family regulator
MLVKAGLGIGLLGSYVVLEPNAVPLSLDVKIDIPLYALALTERLDSRPVKIVFEWLCEIFSETNPWFSSDFRLRHPANHFDDGIKKLFNI